MNKGDLVNEVAKVVSTKKEAQTAVDCVFSSITKALKKGDTSVAKRSPKYILSANCSLI